MAFRVKEGTTAYKALQAYQRHKKWVPALSFSAGFGWDSFTLTRIDLWTDNLILLTYLLLLGMAIVLMNFIRDGVWKHPFLLRYNAWYAPAAQFFLGGLFSSYVVFYFQSAAMSKNWLFLLLLVIVLVGNEFIKDRLSSLTFQFVLFFLATFSFFIFFIPVIIKAMGTWIFLLSSLLSLGLVFGLLALLQHYSTGLTIYSLRRPLSLVASMYVLLLVFYFMNWIPPVPLSLKETGIYHHVKKVGEHYELRFEKGRWYQFLHDSDDPFHYHPGDTVFCYAAVFAPTRLSKEIVHHWQVYDSAGEEWRTTDRLRYAITGGRDGGYRGYTLKSNVRPGEWRVSIETEDGKILGKISFEIVDGTNADREQKTILR